MRRVVGFGDARLAIKGDAKKGLIKKILRVQPFPACVDVRRLLCEELPITIFFGTVTRNNLRFALLNS